MLTSKTIQKLENYWFEDQRFRFLILSSLTIEVHDNLICGNSGADFSLKENQYLDLKIDSYELWVFLIGLFFPKRKLNLLSDRNNLFLASGIRAGEEGKWFKIWKYFAENNFLDFGLNEFYSSFQMSEWEINSFHAGFQKRSKSNIYSKHFYILGQDLQDQTFCRIFQKIFT
jgi:hypothetical protein